MNVRSYKEGERGKSSSNDSGSNTATNRDRTHTSGGVGGSYSNNRHFRQKPILYPALSESDNYDILYSEEGDGEILVEQMADPANELQLITCIDISTLYKEKRTKAIDIAREF